MPLLAPAPDGVELVGLLGGGTGQPGRSQQPHVAVGEGRLQASVTVMRNSIDLGSAAWQILERGR